jgi:hypothetical protein
LEEWLAVIYDDSGRRGIADPIKLLSKIDKHVVTASAR